jgi:hypothetical protein
MWWKHPFAATLFSLATPQKNLQQTVTTLEDFHQWADDNKIIRSVEICQEPGMGGGKGLVATRNLQPGELALHVPRTLTIRTSGAAENSDWAGNMAVQLCELQDEVSLETHEGSVEIEFGASQSYTWKPFSWKPYLEVGVPRDAPYTTSHWTNSELQQLQNETLVQDCQATAKWEASQYQRFVTEHSRADFERALALICSRTLEAGSESRMLVPLLDNANHASKADGGGHFLLGSGSIALFVGEQGAKKGEAVTLDYGARSAEEYAIHYGFVPEDCIGDTISIPGLNTVVSWDDCASAEGHADPAVRLRCSAMLDAYPTSLAEDEELVRSHQGGFDAYRVALAYRSAKKKLLSKAAGR